MPLWKIAWRSIQRRSLASLLTMLSMALGVTLVVAVLLIVGVVDESFRSNSSLGYDTIVGAKGGELQLTLNTVYYLSQPVENLPYEFYRQFLPAASRMDRQAEAGREFADQLEVLEGGEWVTLVDATKVTIPAGSSDLELRVPLLGAKISGPRDFTLTASITSQNTLNRSAFAVATIQPGRRNSTVKIEPDLAETKADDAHSHLDAAQAGDEGNAAVLAPEEPLLEIAATPVAAEDDHAFFRVKLTRPSPTAVVFGAVLSDGADGRYLSYLVDDKIAAIPVCLGDYFKQYRVIGTTAEFFELVFDREKNRTYEFAEGGNFTSESEGFGVFEAILGAKVARDVGLSVGDTIQPSHGAPDGETHQAFLVVGVLEASGTPQDRGVFVNLEGFNQIPDHIREDGKQEVTALLVDTKDAFRSMQLEDRLANEPIGQVVKPVKIIFNLFNSIVGPVRNLLLAITAMICLVSGISILVSIYNSMNDRKQEIAVMRSLGAGRGTVMTVVLLESVMISLAGGILGWVAGHGLIGLASHKIEQETGVVVSAFQLAPPMDELSYLLGPQLTPTISVEIWLIPSLVLLAIVVGFMPALSAYRTDVAKALQSSP